MSVKNEADFKRSLVEQFKKAGHYARRIEDAYSVGFPDLVVILSGGMVFFVEAKLTHGKSYFDPTPRQLVELRRLQITPNALACVLGYDGFKAYLHPPSRRCMISDCLPQADNEPLPHFFMRYANSTTGDSLK